MASAILNFEVEAVQVINISGVMSATNGDDNIAIETLLKISDHFRCCLGPYIKDVRKIFGILDPLPPLVRKFTQPPLLTSSTMSAFGVPPSPPPGADVLYVRSLTSRSYEAHKK